MGRVAVTEDVEGIRDEEDVGDEPSSEDTVVDTQTPPPNENSKRKCIATIIEVQDAFGAINTLRYSQPTHLQGIDTFVFWSALTLVQASARA